MAHEILDNLCVYSLRTEVGGVPWHKIGTGLDQVTADDVRERAGFDRVIGTMPIRVAAPEGAMLPAAMAENMAKSVDGYRATVDLKYGRALGVVSDRFHVLQPDELLQAAMFLVNETGAQISCAATLREGKREVISLYLPQGSNLTARDGDQVKRFFNLGNGHDGSLACSVGASDIRVVCANTLSAWLAGGGSVSIRHRAGIQKALATAVYSFTLDSAERERFYQGLAGRTVSPEEVIAYFEALTGDESREWRKARKGSRSLGYKVAKLLDSGSGVGVEYSASGTPATAWDTFNVATEVITHQTKSTDPLAGALWGSQHKLTARAETLAREMFLAAA